MWTGTGGVIMFTLQSFITFLSPLETISTSLWASLYHHLPLYQYCLFSVMSAVSSYLFISSRLLLIHLRLGCPLLLFSGMTMPIIFLDPFLFCYFPYPTEVWFHVRG